MYIKNVFKNGIKFKTNHPVQFAKIRFNTKKIDIDYSVVGNKKIL